MISVINDVEYDESIWLKIRVCMFSRTSTVAERV